MDRFIGYTHSRQLRRNCHLKSNMDRFIAFKYKYVIIILINLKSNMDRFIAIMRSTVTSGGVI